jgi:ferredoxin-NADP reductase
MQAVLEHLEEQGGGIATFWFRPERPIKFIAGQYLELYLPHEPMDNRGSRRWFTISSSPSEPRVALTMRLPEQPSSFKQTLRTLRVGSTVTLSDPLGDFVLPKDRSIPLVFVAAGTGCTPYASMIKWLVERDEVRDIHLIYATSEPDAFLFHDVWQAYKPLRLSRMVSRAPDTWREHIGHLNTPRVLESLQAKQDSLLYLAGAQSLIEPLYIALLDHLPRSQILLDYFPGY